MQHPGVQLEWIAAVGDQRHEELWMAINTGFAETWFKIRSGSVWLKPWGLYNSVGLAKTHDDRWIRFELWLKTYVQGGTAVPTRPDDSTAE